MSVKIKATGGSNLDNNAESFKNIMSPVFKRQYDLFLLHF